MEMNNPSRKPSGLSICVDGPWVGPPADVVLELSGQATCKQIRLTIQQKGLVMVGFNFHLLMSLNTLDSVSAYTLSLPGM